MVNACYFCKMEETCNYGLFWCSVVYKLWTMVYSLLGISWVVSGSVRDEIWAWKGLAGRRKQAEIIPLTVFWDVCKERNKKEI